MLLFLVSSLLWLLAGGALSLVHSAQLHTVGFFASVEWLTFGRVQAAAESALVYGWVANSGFLACWWMLGRLGGSGTRGAAISLFAAFFWNLGVSLGVLGILAGDLGVYPFFHMPAQIVPLLGVAYCAFALAGVLAWKDREEDAGFAAQWYAVAALYAFPWVCSAAYVMLKFHVLPGVSQAVLAAWAGDGLRLLWIAPIALAAAYYLVPKITGATLPGYSYAHLGFWSLVLFAPWVGTRQLAGGPVPVWVPTLGIASGFLLVVHYLVVASNLKIAFSRAHKSQVLRFVQLGIASYLLLGLCDIVFSLRGVAACTQFTHMAEARQSLLVFGVFTPAILGVFYFLLPRLTGRAWASEGLITSHFTCTWFGLLLLVVGYGVAGFEQGLGLADPKVGFDVIAASMKPWLLIATHGIGIVLLGAVFMLVNFVFHLLPAAKPVTDLSTHAVTPAS
jgi:cytochrome c oxidase cbb3-type subunit 1